jgi:hypothetical protein
VTLSGFASVVTSASGSRPNVERSESSIRTRSADGSWVGVPPPKNTVSTTGRPPLWASVRAASSTSAMAVPAYDSRVAPSPSSSAVYVLKSQ